MYEKIEIYSLLFFVFFVERIKNLLIVGLVNLGFERVKVLFGKIVEDLNLLRWVRLIGLILSYIVY